MTIINTYNAEIWIGLKDRDTNTIYGIEHLKRLCSEWCNNKGSCVSVTETEFIYTNGTEPGAIVGFIQYAEFPDQEDNIKSKAIELAEILMDNLHQFRVSVTTPSSTYMLEK